MPWDEAIGVFGMNVAMKSSNLLPDLFITDCNDDAKGETAVQALANHLKLSENVSTAVRGYMYKEFGFGLLAEALQNN